MKTLFEKMRENREKAKRADFRRECRLLGSFRVMTKEEYEDQAMAMAANPYIQQPAPNERLGDKWWGLF